MLCVAGGNPRPPALSDNPGTVVERANDGLCWKNIKNAGLVSAKPIDLLKITTKSAFFDRLIFGYVCLENSREIGRFFREFAPKNPAKFDFF